MKDLLAMKTQVTEIVSGNNQHEQLRTHVVLGASWESNLRPPAIVSNPDPLQVTQNKTES